jgi:hypothetical protein
MRNILRVIRPAHSIHGAGAAWQTSEIIETFFIVHPIRVDIHANFAIPINITSFQLLWSLLPAPLGKFQYKKIITLRSASPWVLSSTLGVWLGFFGIIALV